MDGYRDIVLDLHDYALKGYNLKDIAKEVGYSERQLRNLFGKKIGAISFPNFRRILVRGCIAAKLENDVKWKDISECMFGSKLSDVSNTYKYYYYNSPDCTLEKAGEETMNNTTQKQMAKAMVLQRLATNPTGNLTLKQLGVSNDIIISLRNDDKIAIISVPGRNGGYNIAKTDKDQCISWINKIRKNRFGITEPYFL